MTLDDTNRLLTYQGGVCALCWRTDPGGRGAWHVDHDHALVVGLEVGERWRSVRGILCGGCNVWVGSVGDSIENLAARNPAVVALLVYYLTATVQETQRRLCKIKNVPHPEDVVRPVTPTVQHARALRVKGMSLRAIAKTLEGLGHLSKAGTRLSGATVRDMLK